MSTTTFTNGVTLSDADWFNDVDAAIYQGTFPTGATALTVTGATTLAVFNTIATTVNAFGAASVALNIGHASAAAAFAGGISIPTGKNVTGAGTATVVGFKSGSFGTAGNQGALYLLGSTSGTATLTTTATAATVTLDKGFSAAGAVLVNSATATPAGGDANVGMLLGSVGVYVTWGSGVPSLSAAKGSLYLRTDGSTTNNRLYSNTDGGVTWTPIVTAA